MNYHLLLLELWVPHVWPNAPQLNFSLAIKKVIPPIIIALLCISIHKHVFLLFISCHLKFRHFSLVGFMECIKESSNND